jgi:cytochrome d ubiquinol oxidase subunit II
VVVVLFVAFSYAETDIFDQLGVNPGVDALGAGLALVATGWLLRQRQQGWAFVMNGLTILLTVSTVFRGLYPRVLISSTDAAYSLTIENAASSEYTLKVMTVVTLVCLPIVLVYQAWSYWVFRKRLTTESELEY